MFATTGLWVWNTRSTPSPCDTLRTVNEELRPRLRLAMTTPSKACRRSRLPSFTFTCTSTVSPGAKGGSLSFICSASSCSIMLLMTLFPKNEAAIVSIALAALPPSATQGLRQSPAADGLVIALQQHRRHPLPVDLFRPRVVRVIEQTGHEGILFGRQHETQHTRQQARHRVHHHHCGEFAAAQHIIADRPFFIDLAVDEALIDAFVAAGDQDHARPRRHLCHSRLIQPAPLRTQVDHPARRRRGPRRTAGLK